MPVMTLGRVQVLSAVGVFLLVVLLYGPTLRGGFVYDSIAQVLYSDYLHTPANWGEVLTLRVVAQDELDRNRPLHLASLMADAAIWGKNPFGYRLTSVLLHALNAALLSALVAIAITRKAVASPSSATVVALWAGVAGALIFALHPLVVEAIAEPSNREDVLVLLPLLIGLVGIVALPAGAAWTLSVLLVICSFFAVLAKESGVAAPFVFAVALWLFRRGDVRRFGPALLLSFLVVAAFLAASYVWRPDASSIFAAAPAPLADSFWSLLALQSRIWALQLWQIVWPWNLSAHYAPQVIAGITWPAALVVIGAVALAAVVLGRTDRLAALGAAVYLLGLLPASNFAAQYHPIADRYLYVPLAGVGLIVAALTGRALASGSRIKARAVVILLLVLLALEYAANLRRQFIWQEPATLWSDALRQSPGLYVARLGLANVHYRAGDFAAARSMATEAVVSSRGEWADAWAVRALCEWQTGARDQALSSLQQAQRLSRAYRDKEALEAAMVLSPPQVAVFEEIVGAP